MSEPNSFSPVLPALQVAWDATSLNDLAFCPRYYQLAHLEGWAGDSTDFAFGGFLADALETFQKSRAGGKPRDEAALDALERALVASWNEDGTQWGGRYEDQWRCTGVTKYKNAKGNAAKCPWSHVGEWFPAPAPSVCGECGSLTATERRYVPRDNKKNRETLIRAVAWYCLDQPERLEDGLHPYVFPNGKIAVEQSFVVPTGWKTGTGEDILLCGHLDYIGELGEARFVVDNKSTTKTLGGKFYQGYSPHMQFDTYDLVGSMLFPDLDIQGVMIDAVQVLVEGVQFGRMPYYKSEAQREEHLQTIRYWVRQAEEFATAGHWPMNKRNCWVCPFAKVCSLDPKDRPAALDGAFKRRERWNPLRER